MTLVSGSWSRTGGVVLLKSALFPIDTNVETPSPAGGLPRSSMPSAPDWEANPIDPRTGRNARTCVHRDVGGIGVDDAHAVGPTRRIPWSRQLDELLFHSRRRACRRPALITMSPSARFSRRTRATTSATEARNGDDREVDVVGHVEDGR